MRKIFNFRPRVKTGHSFDEYISKYSKGFITGKLKVLNSIKELENNHTYWEIDKKFYQIDANQHLKVAGISIGTIGVCLAIILPVTYHYISKEKYIEYNFKYWNENSTSLQRLQHFVRDSVTPGKSTYIPKVDRIATFDMDGTLFGERAPIYIEWLMYDDYLNNVAPEKGDIEVFVDKKHVEPKMKLSDIDLEIKEFMKKERIAPTGLEMHEAYGGAELFSGLTIPEYIKYVDSFLEKSVGEGKYTYFSNLKFKDMFYLPMIEVVEFLQVNNFDVYIVSGTDRFMVRDIVNKHISIPSNKVIGMDVSLDLGKDGIVRRGNELMYKNVEHVKVELIEQEIGKKPVLSFGNSSGDVEMHEYCLSNEKYASQAYMVNNDDNVREYINDRDWSKKNYSVFSMKNDFKTIYGSNVEKIGQ